MIKIKNKKIIVFLSIFSFIGLTYASNNGTIGELFEYAGDQWYLIGENIKDGTVGTDQLGNDSVTSEKIGDGEVKTNNIGNSSVTTEKLGNDSVTSEKIGDGEVKTNNIGNSSVTTEKLGNDSVTSEKIGDGEVKTNNILNNAITQSKTSGGYVDLSTNQSINGIKSFNGDINGKNISLSETLNASEINGVNGNIGTINSQNINSSNTINGNNINTLEITGSGANFNGVNTNKLNSSEVNTLELNTVNLNIDDDLGVGGNITTTGSLLVKSYSEVSGDSYVGQNLTVSGSTILSNNVDVGGNLVIGGNLGFTDPANVPWMDRSINLPFARLGGDFYLPTDVKGDFKGQIHPMSSHARTYIMRESNGYLVGLREGYDGVKQRLFYMYNFMGDFSQMNLTDIEYRPRFLDDLGSDWSIDRFLNGKNNWLTVTATNGTDRKYFLIKHNGTLDPSAHDSVSTVEINSTLANKDTTYVPEKDIFVKITGCLWQGTNMSVYGRSGDNYIAQGITNIRTGDTGTSLRVFHGTPSQGYVTSLDEDKISRQDCGWGANTNLQHEYRSDGVYLQSYIPGRFHFGSSRWNQSNFNLIVKLDDNNNVSYPYYGLDNINNKVEFNRNSGNDLTYFQNNGFIFHRGDLATSSVIKPFHIPNTSTVYVQQKHPYWKYFRIYNYKSNGIIDFSRRYRGIGVDDGSGDFYIGGKSYLPFDASVLGKNVLYTRFIGPKTLYTYSYSNRYGVGPENNHVKVNLSNTDFTRNLDGNNLLGEPNSVDLISNGVLNVGGISIDSSGNMKGIQKNGNQGLVYNSLTSDTLEVSETWNLPVDFESQIKSYIESNDSAIKNTLLSGPGYTFGVNYHILTDNLLGVPYGAHNTNSDNLRRFTSKYAVFSYNSSSLTHIGTFSTGERLNYHVDGWCSNVSGANQNHQIHRNYGVFENSSGVVYAIVPGLRCTGSGYMIKIDGNNLSSKYSGISGSRSVNLRFHSIHPKFGPYGSRLSHSQSRSVMCYIDKTDISNANNRLTTIFENFLSGTVGFNCNNYSLTTQQPQGFILYSSESEVFIDGSYTNIATKMYDLTDPKYGLISSPGEENLLKNRIIYAYMDEVYPGAPAEFKFSFDEHPIRPTMMIINTHDKGIASITMLEGLNITSDDVLINRLKIRDRIEIRSQGGKYYFIDIDSNGNLIIGEV